MKTFTDWLLKNYASINVYTQILMEATMILSWYRHIKCYQVNVIKYKQYCWTSKKIDYINNEYYYYFRCFDMNEISMITPQFLLVLLFRSLWLTNLWNISKIEMIPFTIIVYNVHRHYSFCCMLIRIAELC